MSEAHRPETLERIPEKCARFSDKDTRQYKDLSILKTLFLSKMLSDTFMTKENPMCGHGVFNICQKDSHAFSRGNLDPHNHHALERVVGDRLNRAQCGRQYGQDR